MNNDLIVSKWSHIIVRKITDEVCDRDCRLLDLVLGDMFYALQYIDVNSMLVSDDSRARRILGMILAQVKNDSTTLVFLSNSMVTL